MPRTATAVNKQHDEKELAARFTAIVTELSDTYLERYVAIEALITALLAKENSFLLGPPGTGKSALCRAICQRITDAEFFSVLLDRQLGKEEIFGAYDIAKFDQIGVFERDVVGMLPTAHVAFVDEVGKAGPSTLNPLLTAFNERLFKNGKHELQLPLISAIGASNELLEPELAAMWDRFLVRLDVDYIQEPGNFLTLLGSAVSTGVQVQPTTVTLEELQHVVDTIVPSIRVSVDIRETVLGLRADLADSGVDSISDRRWKQAVRLLQAQAFLHGRDYVDEDDLAILQHVLWEVVEHRTVVRQKVLQLTGPVAREVFSLLADVDEWNKGMDSRKGESTNNRSSYAAEVNKKISDREKEIAEVVEAAKVAGRDTTKITPARAALIQVKFRVYHEFLNMPPESAQRAAEKIAF